LRTTSILEYIYFFYNLCCRSLPGMWHFVLLPSELVLSVISDVQRLLAEWRLFNYLMLEFHLCLRCDAVVQFSHFSFADIN
jgi:hypothetical protein